MVADRLLLTVPGEPETRLYLDSAGNEVLFTDVVEARGLPIGEDGTMRLVDLQFGELPPPVFRSGRMLVLDRFPGPMSKTERVDGVLGPGWFSYRIWRMDLAEGALAICREAPEAPGVEVALGTAQAGFASVDLQVGDDTLVLLWDTGAHTELTEEALIAAPGPAIRATSFLQASTFDRWRAEHPDWSVVENGEVGTGAARLQVPAARLGAVEVGPLWFVRREDANFAFMSRWTDRPVVGALGDNAVAGRVLVVDYPGQRLVVGPR